MTLLFALLLALPLGAQSVSQPALQSTSAPELTVAGRKFRDLNRNGTLEPYEDWRLTSRVRARDIVGRMTLEEKAGAAVHGTAPIAGGPMSSGPAYDSAAVAKMFTSLHVNSVITRMAMPPSELAAQSNMLQRIAERGRLGIPVTISSDPRSHFQHVAGASTSATGFSQWPEPLGFGALDDPALVQKFASIVRGEYRAVGIHMALSPQADLATEPRWSRISGTFGEDPQRVGALVKAYVQGMQGSATRLARNGVATVVKHWVGYGASVDGFDGHNYYGRLARFSGGQFAAHITPFRGAFAAGVVGLMPTYSILENVSVDGAPLEEVGAGFSKQLLTDQLRGKYKFAGLVLSDWGITNDCSPECMTGTPRQMARHIAMPWGVEQLTKVQRFAKGMNAGIDQFGGVDDGAPFVSAVNEKLIPIARLDDAVTRIMTVKFDLGLFENPYVDPAGAARFASIAMHQRDATTAQARALVVLENSRGAKMLPAGAKVFLHGVDAAVARARGYQVVDRSLADVAIIRIKAPYQSLHPTYFFGGFQHEGDLDFKDADSTLTLVRTTADRVPTIVIVYLDRPAVLTALVPFAETLIGEFGASDDAVFDALSGRVLPGGRLPFELPRSMEAVQAQKPDTPHDSRAPLYPFRYRWRK